MWITALQILMMLILNSLSVFSVGHERRIVCFYTGRSIGRPGMEVFTPRDIDPMLCTHLVYAYAGLDDDDKLIPLDPYLDIDKGGYVRFNALKSFNKNLHTLLAVGKGLTKRLSAIAANNERRKKFAKNSVMFLRVNRFSGINLSWQYPGSRQGSTDDKINYVLLVQALREEFERESNITGKPSLLISMDVPHNIKVINGGFDIPSLVKYLDFINVFSFNYRFPPEVEMIHHAPLFPLAVQSDSENIAQQYNVDYTINYYLSLGVCRDKLTLGIPTYGRTLVVYESEKSQEDSLEEGFGMEENVAKSEGSLPYYEICKTLKAKGWEVQNYSTTLVGPYAKFGNFLIGYEDLNSVKLKAQYADKESLGGIMFWAVDYDDFRGNCHGRKFPLIEAGKEGFLTSNRPSEDFRIISNKNGKPLFSFQNEQDLRMNFNVDEQYEEADNTKEKIPSEDTGRIVPNINRLFSTEDQHILEQLLSLIKKIGGVSTLERLLGTEPRTLDTGSFSPLTSLRRSQLGDSYGRTVTSMSVTSAPLTLRKGPTPLVFSNFTVNINELRIDASSLQGR